MTKHRKLARADRERMAQLERALSAGGQPSRGILILKITFRMHGVFFRMQVSAHFSGAIVACTVGRSGLSGSAKHLSKAASRLEQLWGGCAGDLDGHEC